MRISTEGMFARGSASLSAQYGDLAHLRAQVATGRRILTPADDPAASAAVLHTGNGVFAVSAAAANTGEGIIDAGRVINPAALTARTSLGARQAGIARLQDITSAAGVEQQRRLPELQDLDYAQAASDLARGQTMIDANQQTFARLAKLSLFDYLR